MEFNTTMLKEYIDLNDITLCNYYTYFLGFMMLVCTYMSLCTTPYPVVYLKYEYLENEELEEENRKLQRENKTLQKSNKSLIDCINILCETNKGNSNYNLRSKKN